VNGQSVAVRLPIGVNAVTVTVDDAHGHVVSDSIEITVVGENTFTGSGEIVTPPDDNIPSLAGTTAGRVSVTFLGQVLAPGLTWFARAPTRLAAPSGKQLGSAPLYYDVATTSGCRRRRAPLLRPERDELRVP